MSPEDRFEALVEKAAAVYYWPDQPERFADARTDFAAVCRRVARQILTAATVPGLLAVEAAANEDHGPRSNDFETDCHLCAALAALSWNREEGGDGRHG